jgi:transposase
MSVDALGNPLQFQITGGQVHDLTQAEALLPDTSLTYVIADKGYDADTFMQVVHERGAVPVIPPRSNRKTPREYDAHLYKERHLVECFINKLKYYRRIFSRYDKLAQAYLGFLHFASALIWLR